MKKILNLTTRKILLGLVLSFVFSFVFSNDVFAADRYWVDGGASCLVSRTWSNTNCWSLTDGGSGGAGVPGVSDTVIFTGNGNANCNIDTAVSVVSITTLAGTTPYTGTISANSNNITTSGVMTLNSGTLTLGDANTTVGGIFTINGATVNGGTGRIDFNSTSATSFNLDSGTFISTSNRLYLSGGWDQEAAAIFDHNNGSVIVDGTSNSAFVLKTASSLLTLNDLSISKSSDSAYLSLSTAGDKIEVLGNLRLSNGMLYLSSATNELIAEGTLSWIETFDGSFTFTAGILTIKTTANVVIPQLLSTSGRNLPGMYIDAENKEDLLVEYTGSSDLIFYGNVTIVGATYINKPLLRIATLENNGTGNFRFEKVFTLSGGTFKAGTGASTPTVTHETSSSQIVINGGLYDCEDSELLVLGGMFYLSGGTFTAENSKINNDGTSAWIISGGVFEAPSDVFYMRSGFTISGGTFNHNSGTIILDGSTSTTFTLNGGAAGSLSLYNLTLNKDSASYNLNISGAGDVVIVLGNLKLQNGMMILSNATSELRAEGTLEWLGTFDGSPTWAYGFINIMTTADVVIPEHETVTGRNLPGLTIDPSNKSDLSVSYSGIETVTIIGDFLMQNTSVSGATFSNSSTGNIIFARNFTINNGTFVAGTTAGQTITFSTSNPVIVNGGLFDCALSTITFTGSSFTLAGGEFDATNASMDFNGYNTVTISGGVFNAPSGNMYLSQNLTINNTGQFNHNSGTVVFDSNYAATVNVLGTVDFNNVRLEKTAIGYSVTLASSINIEGDLTLIVGTFRLMSYTLNFGGDLYNETPATALFTAGTGTVVLDGTDQSLHGNTTFYRLTKIATEASTLFFDSASTTIVTNIATLQGLDSANRLSLRSGTDGVQWLFDPQSTRTFSYLDVKDSDNINFSVINLSGTGSANSGNNSNWSFGEKYWVGSYTGCSGDFSDSDCWSDSSGGAGGAGVPGASHLIYFNLDDTASCYIDSSVSVSGIRVYDGYTGLIESTTGVTLTVGIERFLQTGGEVSLNGANMVNTDNFYVYGGAFEMGDGDFSSLDFYYNYFEPYTGSADFSAASIMDVNGHFVFGSNTATSSGTFKAPSGNLNISGNFYSYASNNSVFNPNGGTVVFDGATATNYDYYDSSVSFNNLTLDKDTNVLAMTLTDDIDINGNLNITRGRFNAPDWGQVYLAGNFIKNDLTGTFIANTSEFVFDGGSQTIFESNNFYKFTKIASAANQTLSFQAGKTTTISNLSTIKGTVWDLLILRSTSDGNEWYINPSGTRDMSYVDVKDSNNTNTLIISAIGSIDSLNNTNWNFGKKFWVGTDGASWNDTNNWSLISGGSGGAGVPGVNDNVIFDNANDCVIPNLFDIDIASLTLASTYTAEVRGGNGLFETQEYMNINGGKFSVDSKTLTVGGDFYQKAGIFQGGANNITIADNLTISGGSFYAGSGSTFIVNTNLAVNSVVGDLNTAIVDFYDIGTLDINNSLYLGTTTTGDFYAPYEGTMSVSLDAYFSTDCHYVHENSTLLLDGGNNVTFQPSNQYFYNVSFDKQSPLNTVLISTDLLLVNDVIFTVGTVNPAGDIYIAGDWNMGSSTYANFASSYSSGDKTVYFNGEDQAVNGSTTFANFSKIVSGSAVPPTLTFEESETQTITGTMILNGSSISMRLLIRSSLTDTQALIDPQGARSIQFVDVKDNYNIASEIIAYNTGSVDSLNNTNWAFELSISSWVDAFSSFNMRLFAGAYRGAMIIYNIIAPYTNGWSYDEPLSTAGRIRSTITFDGALYLGASDGYLYRSSDIGADLLSADDVMNGQYSLLSLVFDRADPNYNAKMYINGIENSYRNFNFDLESNAGDLLVGTSYGASIGGNNASGEEYFEGKIDEFRISSQAFTPSYITTVKNNMNDPSTFVSFGSEEEYAGQGTGTGTGELPTMTTQEAVSVRGEIGSGTMWISGSGAFTNGIRLEKGIVSALEQPIKWLYDEDNDYITFRDSSSPDGFRIDLYMSSEDAGNFVYSGTSVGSFNIPVENFKVFGNFNTETGEGFAPSKGVDDPTATLNIDSAESCSEALNMDNYVFSSDLSEGDFALSMTGAAQTYLRSNVSCITQGSIDIRAMELLLPPSCVEGEYSSTLYILIVNGS